jgi:hypothetical protein
MRSMQPQLISAESATKHKTTQKREKKMKKIETEVHFLLYN